jgi:hypothetical protein
MDLAFANHEKKYLTVLLEMEREFYRCAQSPFPVKEFRIPWHCNRRF